jgi:hypothetical protein
MLFTADVISTPSLNNGDCRGQTGALSLHCRQSSVFRKERIADLAVGVSDGHRSMRRTRSGSATTAFRSEFAGNAPDSAPLGICELPKSLLGLAVTRSESSPTGGTDRKLFRNFALVICRCSEVRLSSSEALTAFTVLRLFFACVARPGSDAD